MRIAGIQAPMTCPLNCNHGNPTNPLNRSNLIEIKTQPRPITRMTAGHVNARSVRNKTSEIVDHIRDHDLDIVAITETWLRIEPTDAISIGDLEHTYTHSSMSQDRGKRGGGVALRHKSNLDIKKSKSSTKFKSFEHLESKITTGNRTVTFVVIY